MRSLRLLAQPPGGKYLMTSCVCLLKNKKIKMDSWRERLKEKRRKGKMQTHIFHPLCLRLKRKCLHFHLRLGANYE